MSFHRRIGRSDGTRFKRALGVQAALEWAFRVEKAQLELPLPQDVNEAGFGFGLEYVLLQRAALGCKIDGGQHKIGGYSPHRLRRSSSRLRGVRHGITSPEMDLSRLGASETRRL